MTDIEFLQSEVQRLGERANHFELLWRRVTDGARGAGVGLARAMRREYRARCDLIIAEGEIERLRNQVAEQEKKLERLSLRIMHLWSQE